MQPPVTVMLTDGTEVESDSWEDILEALPPIPILVVLGVDQSWVDEDRLQGASKYHRSNCCNSQTNLPFD